MTPLRTLAAGIALAVAGLMAAPASAAPAGLAAFDSAGLTKTATETVNWRPYRHCHWRRGDRWCHGGRAYYRGRGPGINLYIGPSRRGRHNRRNRW
jgi:hypothetical protein